MNKQELARRIVRDMGYEYQTVKNIIDGIAFEGWLHDPNQVPGRTITESQLVTLYDWARDYVSDGWRGRDVLADIGITVVPDPEPTNAEKLAGAITNAAHGVGIGSTTANIKAIAEHLDAAGVRAGGDDE